jgi:ATP-binding cassette subfamily F protein 3
MPLISFDAVAAEYGATTVFSDLTFALQPGQRLGVVGPNGAGKSTMLRLISGEGEPAAGNVTRQRGLRVGMLDQFDADLGAADVLEQTISARADLLDLRHRLHALEQRLATGDHGDAVMAEYSDVQHRYDHGGGYTLEARAREVLGGLGFLDEALEHPAAELSGGQRRRVQLAQLLLLDADVYLLDEPTNHLDLGSIEWLQDYLRAAPQAMLIVSHDRRLLDEVADSILELEAGRGYVYTGNYSKFVRLRAERRREQLRQYEAQQGHIAHQEAFIQRYKAGQRAREARGRQTRLDRLERVDAPTTDREIKIQVAGGGLWRRADGGGTRLRGQRRRPDRDHRRQRLRQDDAAEDAGRRAGAGGRLDRLWRPGDEQLLRPAPRRPARGPHPGRGAAGGAGADGGVRPRPPRPPAVSWR